MKASDTIITEAKSIASYIKATDKKNNSNFFDGFLDILDKKHISSALRLVLKCYIDSIGKSQRIAMDNAIKATMASQDDSPFIKEAMIYEARQSILLILMALFSVSVSDLNKPLDGDGA